MKVTIDIPDVYVPILRKWASVSRTLTRAGNLIQEFAPSKEDSELKNAQAFECVEELDDLTTPLDVLHQTVRSAIWVDDRRGKEEKVAILELTGSQASLIALALDLHRFITEDGKQQKRIILGLISEALETK